MNTLRDDFIQAYYSSGAWRKNYWAGKSVGKNPCDMMIEQELIFNVKPDTIVECGTGAGGSALFYYHCSKMFDHPAQVISIDINADTPNKPIVYFRGSSIDQEIFNKVRSLVSGVTMVILDSDHTKEHVLQEMHLYSTLVTIGSYLIVEDTIIGGHPVRPAMYPGPFEAVEEFLSINTNFIIDAECEKHLLTFNKSGYLKKVK